MKISVVILVFLYGSVQCNKTTIFNELLTFQNIFFNNLDAENVTEACRISIDDIKAVNNVETFLEILKFLDSSSKIPNGMLSANLYDLGNYEECMGIHLTLKNKEIRGKYCFGVSTVTIPGEPSTNISLQLAYCVPSTCSNEDIKALIPIGDFTPTYCYTELDTHDFDAPDITAIVIFSFFLLLVVLSTGLDLIYQYSGKESPNKLLIAFSFWTNGKKLFKTTSNSEQLLCLNGIKALSMMWVILGHSTNFTIVENGLDMINSMKATKNMYLMAGSVSVDTFLLIGGLLVMYVFLKSCDKVVKMNVPKFYLHRYLRLTPALAMIVLFNATLERYFGSGPMWGGIENSIAPCRKYWWSTLLYIQNYVNPEENCLGQSWYLSVDMQLFILTPIILIPMQTSAKVGFYSLIALTLAGILAPFFISYQMELAASNFFAPQDEQAPYLIYYYRQTYTRFGPYVIGMIAGYLIFKAQKHPDYVLNKIKDNKIIITILWLIAIGGLLACTYEGSDILTAKVADKLSKSLYNGLNRNAWSVAVSLVIILCCLNCGGPINDFLSAPIFQFLAKLSYSMYLLHVPWIVDIKLLSMKTISHFSTMNMFLNFWGDFMITLIASFIWCLIFESPMIIIEKAIFAD